MRDERNALAACYYFSVRRVYWQRAIPPTWQPAVAYAPQLRRPCSPRYNSATMQVRLPRAHVRCCCCCAERPAAWRLPRPPGTGEEPIRCRTYGLARHMHVAAPERGQLVARLCFIARRMP